MKVTLLAGLHAVLGAASA